MTIEGKIMLGSLIVIGIAFIIAIIRTHIKYK